MGLLSSSEPTFYKARDGAAFPGGSFDPPHIYCVPAGVAAATIAAFEKSGTLEKLSGPPSPGIDFFTVTPSWFMNPTEPPKPEALLTTDELLARLNITERQLDVLRGQYAFPRFTATREVRLNPNDPYEWRTSTALLWSWATIERWRQGNPLTNPRSGTAATAGATWGE